jgi:hypothetical protein
MEFFAHCSHLFTNNHLDFDSLRITGPLSKILWSLPIRPRSITLDFCSVTKCSEALRGAPVVCSANELLLGVDEYGLFSTVEQREMFLTDCLDWVHRDCADLDVVPTASEGHGHQKTPAAENYQIRLVMGVHFALNRLHSDEITVCDCPRYIHSLLHSLKKVENHLVFLL